MTMTAKQAAAYAKKIRTADNAEAKCTETTLSLYRAALGEGQQTFTAVIDRRLALSRLDKMEDVVVGRVRAAFASLKTERFRQSDPLVIEWLNDQQTLGITEKGGVSAFRVGKLVTRATKTSKDSDKDKGTTIEVVPKSDLDLSRKELEGLKTQLAGKQKELDRLRDENKRLVSRQDAHLAEISDLKNKLAALSKPAAKKTDSRKAATH